MGALLGVVSGVGFLVCIIMVIVSAIKKNGKIKKWSIGIGICVVAFIVALAITPTTTPTTSEIADKKTPEQIAQEKEAAAKVEAEAEARINERVRAEAKAIPYKDLARNPDDYKWAPVTYTGKVIQVVEEGNTVTLRVNITKTDYGYEDTVFVVYPKRIVSGRILEEDIITFWGNFDGLETYKTVLGSEVTIPLIRTKIIEVKI